MPTSEAKREDIESGLNGLPCMPLLAYFTSHGSDTTRARAGSRDTQFNIVYIRPTEYSYHANRFFSDYL